MRIQGTIKRSICLLAELLSASIFMSVLSGCHAVPILPGREPFGEQTASEDKAKGAYEAFADSFQAEQLEAWDGYTISWSEGSQEVDVYLTEEYVLAYCEDRKDGDYLWFDGWLYWMKGDSVTYREMSWEELQTEQMAAELWTMAQKILKQTPAELTYKYIPMSNDKRMLLTADYDLDEEQAGDYATISARIGSGGRFDHVGFRWQDVGDLSKGVGVDNVTVSISFFPVEGTTDLQAERKIWSFGHDCGLIEQGVPALSRQNEEREWCREIISSIDFAALRDQAVEQEDLVFPGFQERGFEREP